MTPFTVSDPVLGQAASEALWLKLSAPPKVFPDECQAFLLEFTSPAHEDRFDSPDYHHGILIITRGSFGHFDSTAGVYACDASGELERDDDEKWIRLADPKASTMIIDPKTYLLRSGLHV